jgi:hypothetical protein
MGSISNGNFRNFSRRIQDASLNLEPYFNGAIIVREVQEPDPRKE